MRHLLPLIVMGLAMCFPALAGAELKIEVITGDSAPPLELRAADEIAAALRRLYKFELSVASKPSGKLPVIFVGSPATNKSLEFFAATWPKLGTQGHIVKSATFRDQPGLVIGGETGQATYWAAAEYLHALGVRSTLYGDLDPIVPREFSFGGFDIKREPASFSRRAWQLGGTSPVSTISWGRDDLQKLIGQLAKLKFNKIMFPAHAEQPFVDWKVAGVRPDQVRLWDGEPLPVSGDTAGRSAFKGTKFFENPDFAGKQTRAEQLAAGRLMLQSIIDTAHSYGMTVGVTIDSSQIPVELAKDDAARQQVAEALVRSYQLTYPGLDQIYRRMTTSYMPVLRTPKINQLDLDTPFDTKLSLRKLGSDDPRVVLGLQSHDTFFLPLTGEAPSILPQTSPADLLNTTKRLATLRNPGFVAQYSCIGDLDFVAYSLSRTDRGESLLPPVACEQFLTPVCGEEVHTRVAEAMQLVERAALSIDLNDPKFALVEPTMMLKHYEAAEPAPEWWGKVRESYLNAMNEMYRANTRAREGSRSYTLYLARRYEFGFEYMNCVQAVRAAGVAKKEKDKEKQIAELEKAIDSINGACNALAAVARSNSDRGTIAVLNAYVYRPLVKELEKVDAEE